MVQSTTSIKTNEMDWYDSFDISRFNIHKYNYTQIYMCFCERTNHTITESGLVRVRASDGLLLWGQVRWSPALEPGANIIEH